MRILVIEDDTQVGEFLTQGLKEHGHTVKLVQDGREGLLLGATDSFDAMIIDRMLPRVDGLSIVRTLRAGGARTPILILSALGQVDDRVQGLRVGGDDYLAKPFAFSELLARLDALMRRGHSSTASPPTRLEMDDLVLDLLTRSATRGAQVIPLKDREFRLLEYLFRHKGQIVTRTMLLEGVWDYDFDPQTNVIDVHISRLRQKIDKPFPRQLIHTVRGAGYMLCDTDEHIS